MRVTPLQNKNVTACMKFFRANSNLFQAIASHKNAQDRPKA